MAFFDFGLSDILGGIGGYLGGRSQAKQMEEDREQRRREQEQQQKQFMMQFLSGEDQRRIGNDQSQAQTGLASTQMDPYAAAKAKNAANVRRSFAEGLGPNGKFNGSYDMSALQAPEMGRSADNFYTNVAKANPGVPLGDVNPIAEQRRVGFQTDANNAEAASKEKINQFLNAPALTPQEQVLEWMRKFGPQNRGLRIH